MEPKKAAECVIVVENSPYQNTAIHKASVSSSEKRLAQRMSVERKIIHLMR
jgi:hypothetical protein